MKPLVCVAVAVFGLSLCAAAQEPSKAAPPSVADRLKPEDGTQTTLKNPFSARLTLESELPVVYGDDVMVAVELTGSQQLSVLRVSAEPTGSLRSIYLTGPEGGELERGIQCALSGTNLAANSTVLANCTLTSRDTGWSNWLSMASLFQSRSGRINVEVLVDDAGTPTSFSEHVNISLVSPKSHVILGGFFGATMWAIFLTLSAPSPNERRQQVENWKALSDRLRTRAPDVIDRAWLGFMHILKRAFVGGFVALVLIAVAKGTEGFEPPISVQVHDFWGGMMIGILSMPLAKWLRRKLSKV